MSDDLVALLRAACPPGQELDVAARLHAMANRLGDAHPLGPVARAAADAVSHGEEGVSAFVRSMGALERVSFGKAILLEGADGDPVLRALGVALLSRYTGWEPSEIVRDQAEEDALARAGRLDVPPIPPSSGRALILPADWQPGDPMGR